MPSGQYGRRRAFLSIFPAAVLGSSSTTWMALGVWCDPFNSRTIFLISSGSTCSPGRAATKAVTASPHRGSGTPITATADTPAQAEMTSSTSRGYTLNAPETMTSFFRSTR